MQTENTRHVVHEHRVPGEADYSSIIGTEENLCILADQIVTSGMPMILAPMGAGEDGASFAIMSQYFKTGGAVVCVVVARSDNKMQDRKGGWTTDITEAVTFLEYTITLDGHVVLAQEHSRTVMDLEPHAIMQLANAFVYGSAIARKLVDRLPMIGAHTETVN